MNAVELAEAEGMEISLAPRRRTQEELDEVVHAILHDKVFEEFGGVSYNAMGTSSSLCFYVGTTKRELKQEYTGFLTKRGGHYTAGKEYTSGKYEKQIPILMHKDRKVITELQFRGCGGKVVKVFESIWQFEACYVEECLQAHFQHLPKGRRLWHEVAKGAKYDMPPDSNELGVPSTRPLLLV